MCIRDSFCEVVPVDPNRLTEVVGILGELVPGVVARELAPGADRVSIPAPDGAATLSEVLRRIDHAGIPLADIALRRPSLDDVFLSLTGHSNTAATK